jgi:hypothetical protein
MAVSLRGGDGVQIKEQLIKDLKTEVLPEAKATNALEGLEVDWQKANPSEWVRSRFSNRSRNHLVRVANG